jgi:hypothetical protein
MSICCDCSQPHMARSVGAAMSAMSLLLEDERKQVGAG